MQRRLGVHRSRFPGASKHAAEEMCVNEFSDTNPHDTLSPRLRDHRGRGEQKDYNSERSERSEQSVPPGYDRMAAFRNSAAGAAGLRSSLSTFCLGVGRDHEPKLLRVVDS